MALNETDHDRLIRIDENVNMIKGLLEKYEEELAELDGRVGGVERFQARMLGLAGGVSFVISFIWSQLHQMLGGV